ncbi:MAG: hypothetical protein GC159_11455 [Phycisphaera sp.]|nr:hypothetical protein [Phycisphaera sp.]
MGTRHRQRNVIFDVVDGVLERKVIFPDGRTYTHRCTRQVFEEVAHAIEERGAQGVTLDPLAKALDLPFTQVNVALEFMKERGCVVTRGRRNYPASNFLYEDAMIEFTFLAELPY